MLGLHVVIGAYSQVLSSSVRLVAVLWSSSTLLLMPSRSPLHKNEMQSLLGQTQHSAGQRWVIEFLTQSALQQLVWLHAAAADRLGAPWL